MQKYAIIVAGGKGLRMGGDIPKQFMPVEGMPILMRTIRRFLEYDSSLQVVLVLPQSHFDFWADLCREYSFSLPFQLVEGGETRYHSVRNGLHSIQCQNPLEACVAVHDGVRPFVSVETIAATFEEAARSGSAVPVVDSVDSLRELTDDGTSVAKDRSRFKLVQTPQTFRLDILRRAYELPFRDTFTDDASVVEASGESITLVQGNRENIKITTTFDMRIASSLV